MHASPVVKVSRMVWWLVFVVDDDHVVEGWFGVEKSVSLACVYAENERVNVE
jgi:hypothetical protein